MNPLKVKYSYDQTNAIHQLQVVGLKATPTVKFDVYEHAGFVMPTLYQGLHDQVAELWFQFQVALKEKEQTSQDALANILANGWSNFILRLMAMRNTPEALQQDLIWLVNRLDEDCTLEELIAIVPKLHDHYTFRPLAIHHEKVDYTISILPGGKVNLRGTLVTDGRLATGEYQGEVVATETDFADPAIQPIVDALMSNS